MYFHQHQQHHHHRHHHHHHIVIIVVLLIIVISWGCCSCCCSPLPCRRRTSRARQQHNLMYVCAKTRQETEIGVVADPLSKPDIVHAPTHGQRAGLAPRTPPQAQSIWRILLASADDKRHIAGRVDCPAGSSKVRWGEDMSRSRLQPHHASIVSSRQRTQIH